MKPDALMAANTPTFDHLMAKGLYTLEARTQFTKGTWSGPGWSSILKGVEADKIGIAGNKIKHFSKMDCRYKSFLWHVKQSGLTTAAVNGWNDLLCHLIEQDATDLIRQRSDGYGTWLTEDLLEFDDYDLIFRGMSQVDKAGHSYGFTSETPKYLAEIEEKDG